MLTDEINDIEAIGPEELLDRYHQFVNDIITDIGRQSVESTLDIPDNRILSFLNGDPTTLTIEDVAAIIAMTKPDRDQTEILADIEDQLLFGMTTAVLNVDTVSASIDPDISPKEVQQKLEGRLSMDLREYAHIRHFIATKQW